MIPSEVSPRVTMISSKTFRARPRGSIDAEDVFMTETTEETAFPASESLEDGREETIDSTDPLMDRQSLGSAEATKPMR